MNTYFVASNGNYSAIVVTDTKENAVKIAKADFERKWGKVGLEFFTAYTTEEYFVENSAYSIIFED